MSNYLDRLGDDMKLYDEDEKRSTVAVKSHLECNRARETKKELNSCPFCGSDAELTESRFGGVSFGVRCKNVLWCGAGIFAFRTQNDVISTWNKRAEASS